MTALLHNTAWHLPIHNPPPEQDVVLVVDDDPDARAVLEIMLEEEGRRVVAVESGEAALEWLAAEPTSLVLLDVTMPGLSGYETALRIRAQERFFDLPILFLTATYSTEEFAAHGFGVGAHDCLTKPPDPILLRNKVAIFLRLYRQQQSLEYELLRRRLAEDALRLSSIVFEHSPEGVLITDAQSIIHSVNRAFERATGYSATEAIGQTPRLLYSGRHDKAFYRKLWQALAETGQWQGEIWNRRKDGGVFPEWLNIVAVRDDGGKVANYVGIFSDLSGRDRLRERLHEFAYYDPLTGLPNRQMLFDRLRLAVAQSRQEKGSLAVALIDLDRLRRVNDTFGHTLGDALLQQVADRLQSGVRAADTVARLDGDVFALLLPLLGVTDDAARLVHQLLLAINQPVSIDGQEFRLSASAGISVYPDDGSTPEDLVKHADTALHLAKESGGDSYQFYTPVLGARARERLIIENDLRQAIEQKSLNLVYQPQISLRDGRLIGVEALARWRHPQRGPIPPVDFIPVAEDAGLIEPLGAWVLETACRQALAWASVHGRPVRVAVNVSGHQIREGGLHDVVERCLKLTELPAEYLELELTESMLMEAADETMVTLRELNALGVQISIDDFGTGYSSLSYLKRFAIHKIKIDRSFVNGIPADQNDIAIVEAVIAMAHRLNLKVVAEGVETPAQLEFLRQAGCDEIQGYYFSRPVAPDDLRAFLGDRVIEPRGVVG